MIEEWGCRQNFGEGLADSQMLASEARAEAEEDQDSGMGRPNGFKPRMTFPTPQPPSGCLLYL